MKTNELKACPFCGRNDRLIFEPLPGCTDVGNVACVCGASYTTITQGVDDWNTRPIEDGLQAEIEKLKKQVKEQPTTNCSKLEQAFTVESKKITPAYFRNAIRRKSDREHIGFVNEETGKLDFAFMAAIYGFAPLELRQLADLVEETLKGNE